MGGLKVLYRHVQEVPAEKWMEKLELERLTDEAEAEAGYPLPRRYRTLFTNEHSQTVRVEARIFESYLDFGLKMEARARNQKLLELDARRRSIIQWEREELFYVDSGSPVPRWMQAISRQKIPEEQMKQANVYYPPNIPTPEQVQKNIEQGKLRILYRTIQEVPKDRWGEKLEQERINDKAEAGQGHPIPMRYRAMFGSEKSQVRINEREYPSYAEFCKSVEYFIADNGPGNQAVMDAEIRRQGFFSWEREEVYIVDSDSYTPMWMKFAAEDQGLYTVPC